MKIVNTINVNSSNIPLPIWKELIPEYKVLNQPIKPLATPSRPWAHSHYQIRFAAFVADSKKPHIAQLSGAGDGELQSWHTLPCFPQNQPFSTVELAFSTTCGKSELRFADLWSASSNSWRTAHLNSCNRPILQWAGWWGSFQWTLPQSQGNF